MDGGIFTTSSLHVSDLSQLLIIHSTLMKILICLQYVSLLIILMNLLIKLIVCLITKESLRMTIIMYHIQWHSQATMLSPATILNAPLTSTNQPVISPLAADSSNTNCPYT